MESSSGNISQNYAIDVNVGDAYTVVHTIASLYQDGIMNDICLLVNGNEYPAHRLILSALSDVFRAMLMNPQWLESRERIVVLQETPQCAKVFGEFLRYFYTGFVRMNHEVVVSLLTLADKYNVKSLNSLCVAYMRDHIPRAAVNNQLVSWLQYTKCCGHKDVSKACKNFVKWNFSLIADSTDFGNLDVYLLISLLKKSDLVVYTEMYLFNQVVRWLRIQEEMWQMNGHGPEEVRTYMVNLISEVMDYIRFPMMNPHQLAQLLLNPLVLQHKEFFVEKMSMAMVYHAGQRNEKIQEAMQTEKGRLQFTPRLYTAFRWSSVLSVENYVSLPCYHTSTHVFSSHCTIQEWLGEHCSEWVVEILPKGVWFRKCHLIVWQGMVEIPEAIVRTVRLAISCKDIPPSGEVLMRVGVLIHGAKNNIEHICKVVQKVHRFTEDDRLINFDDLIPFDELNPTPRVLPTNTSYSNPYLVGPKRDTLQVHIVMVPLTGVCFK